MSLTSNQIQVILRGIEESNGVVMRGFRSTQHLRDRIQETLDAGGKFAFVPSLKTLRHFLNTAGFIATMAEVRCHLGTHSVIVEAGRYGSIHAFAVAPGAKGNDGNDE